MVDVPVTQAKPAEQRPPLVYTTDQATLDELHQKDNLFQMISKSISYKKHPAHKALFDALALSLSVDEDDMDRKLKEPHRKDSDAPSFKKTKDQPTSFKKVTTLSKPSKLDKSVQEEETVEELDQEEAMDDEEPAIDEVVNSEEHPQDDAGLSQD
ncbi:hypothetical protein Tco_1208559, partial [Tanacetum coccineum]